MLDAKIGFDSVPLTLLEALSSFAFLRSFSRYYDTMYSWYYVLCTMYYVRAYYALVEFFILVKWQFIRVF